MTINNTESVIDIAPEKAGAIVKFSARFMAFSIDMVVLIFFMVMLLVFTGKNFVALSDAGLSFDYVLKVVSSWLGLLTFGGVISCMCYFCLMHAWFGQTIGKKIMRIRLESSMDEGLSFGTCFLRWVGYLASALPLFFGFLWALLDVRGRTWHDRLAGTRVVYSQ